MNNKLEDTEGRKESKETFQKGFEEGPLKSKELG